MKTQPLITFLILSLVTITSTTLKADTLGVYLSAGSWQPSISGVFSDNGPNLDLESDLNFNDDSTNTFSIVFEHPIFMLPNLKIQQTALDSSSNVILSSDLSFSDVTFDANSALNSQLDLSHTDYILYYEILDNIISVDLGVSLLNFDGGINLNNQLQSADINIDEIIPALYGKAVFELPLTGSYVGAQASVLSISDSSISDLYLYIGWESDNFIGAEIGYHKFEVDWDDFNNSDGNVSFDGYYAAVTFHF